MNKKVVVLLAVLGVLVVILGGLAAAWYWAGPWLAQEYVDYQHPDWDVVFVERLPEKGAVVFIVILPDRQLDDAEVEAALATIGQTARVLGWPTYEKVVILAVHQSGAVYPMQAEIVAPIEKTNWQELKDCQATPLWIFGVTLKAEYVIWPD